MNALNYFACSRMYNVGDEVVAAWDQLYAFVAQAADVPLKIIYNSHPEPIEALWARPHMGCVLMCGYPFIRATPRPTLLATPVPALAQYENRPVYSTHLLVATDSNYQSIEDTFGGRISWTIENSQSGFNAVRHYLLQFLTPNRRKLYSDSIGPIGTFTVGIDGIRNGTIDVVPIDSFSYDLMQRYRPDLLEGSRIIATTPSAPFPPMVAAHDMDPSIAARLRSVLVTMHAEAAMASILDTLLISRFVDIPIATFEHALKQAEAADAEGYYFPS